MLIRTLSADDVPALAMVLADPEVMRYSIRGVLTTEQTAGFVEGCIGLYHQHGYGPWALIEKGSARLIGFCGLNLESIEGVEEIHVGYRLARPFWGFGLATEAVQAVLHLGFQELALPAISAIVEPQNIASVRVLEKSGFTLFEDKTFHARSVRLYRQWPVLNGHDAHRSGN